MKKILILIGVIAVTIWPILLVGYLSGDIMRAVWSLVVGCTLVLGWLATILICIFIGSIMTSTYDTIKSKITK